MLDEPLQSIDELIVFRATFRCYDTSDKLVGIYENDLHVGMDFEDVHDEIQRSYGAGTMMFPDENRQVRVSKLKIDKIEKIGSMGSITDTAYERLKATNWEGEM